MMAFEIAGRPIGPEHRPYVVAEAGVHHGNSLPVALRYILEARVAGADAVKFQTYTASRLAARWAPTYWDDPAHRSQFDIFAGRSLLGRDDYARMFEHAAAVGITLLSTPFDSDAAGMLDALGMAAFKIASADITNFPLLDVVAGFGKPVLLSTGAATLDEIRAAVGRVRVKNDQVALLHCNLAYPTPLVDANLRRIELLREAFPEATIGYSDHTRPDDSALACPLAVALGAHVIEKHFTLNRLLPGDDHYHAVDADGLARLVRDCGDAHLMTRRPRETTESEHAARQYARRSIVAARHLQAGHVLKPADVDFKRPGTGLPPSRVDEVVGRTLVRELAADALVQLDDLA